MAKKDLPKLLEKLPNTPGVYKFKDRDGAILYVGKAKNLNKRVRSYFRNQSGRPKRTEKLIEKTEDLEWIEVGSDLEALILETNLIKELRPKYNILMKDDKNFVYIKITKDEAFPRIQIVRRLVKDGSRYFGPKTSASKVKKTLLLLQKLFMYRSCDLEMDWKDGRVKITKKTMAFPCLDYHIKRCAGPCISEINPEEYGGAIQKIEYFLEGKTEEIEILLKRQMEACVEAKQFEKAALLRDKLLSIEELMEKQLVSAPTDENMDVFGFALEDGKAYFNLFMVRGGKLVNQENFVIQAPGFVSGDETQAEDVLESFLFQYYERAADIPSQILIPLELKESFFEEWVRQQRNGAVTLKIPQRGKKNKLLDLAEQNARSFQKQHKARWSGFETRDDEAALDELAEFLDMQKAPKRIECFDVSHLSGTDTVASMVVFEKGRAKKSDYRKFRLKGLSEGEIDDFKSMNEILHRRLAYLAKGPANLSIRKATKSKLKEINALFFEWRQVEMDLKGELEEYYLAIFEKEVVGVLRLIPGKAGAYLLRSLYITPKHRLKGVARALIEESIRKVKAKRVYLDCSLHLKSFYEDLGFEQIKHFPKEFHSHEKELQEHAKECPDDPVLYYAYDPDKHRDPSFETKPQLLVIDGGKGQLNAALKARDHYGLNIPMVGLAKREEDIFVEGKSLPLMIPKDTKALMMLRRLRDEAHRFAISFQRDSRKKDLTSSELDKIRGIGPTLKMKLLKRFGSVEQIKKASKEDLEAFIGADLAEKLKKELT